MKSDIDYLLRRGVAEVIVQDDLSGLLRSGKKLRLKEGFDPSSPDIHLGHMVALRKLRQFQESGHQVVLIVGDWTAQIGDPSGASVTRPMLSAEQVKANAQTYMEQFFKIVDRSKTEVRWQSEWFGKFTLVDVIRLTSRFTVAQILARDDFNKRFNAGRPITVTELLYPLLQAYDSVMVQADVEFGGIDQKFNILFGRELQSVMGQRSQQCFMTPLLVGTDGSHKMSKSLGNYIGVAEPPQDIYGKVMSITDSLILQYFELLTDVLDEELEEFKQALTGGKINPMVLKKRLACEIIIQLDGKAAALEAEQHFEKVVQKKEMPDDVPEIKITPELIQKIQDRSCEENGLIVSIKEVGKPEATRDWIVSVPLLLCAIGLAKSGSEARRLIEQKSIRIDGKTICMDETRGSIRIGSIIQAGKRRYVRMVADESST
ncbi:MAG: tyrosine--tRNA ligase [Dehalococcoidales bacterium]|nr:tyrosine--tRNA ligase [Dehalococcoidales bacterium]